MRSSWLLRSVVVTNSSRKGSCNVNQKFDSTEGAVDVTDESARMNLSGVSIEGLTWSGPTVQAARIADSTATARGFTAIKLRMDSLRQRRRRMRNQRASHQDRKSTRLNSSHSQISYAVL